MGTKFPGQAGRGPPKQPSLRPRGLRKELASSQKETSAKSSMQGLVGSSGKGGEVMQSRRVLPVPVTGPVTSGPSLPGEGSLGNPRAERGHWPRCGALPCPSTHTYVCG